MQFVRFRHRDQIGYGVLEGEAVNPLAGDPFGPLSRAGRGLPLSAVTLLAPVVPGKIVSAGGNFAARAAEAPLPALVLKPPSAVIGPEAAIVLPPQSRQVEHGAGLAVVIGRPARWVAPEEALGHVLGYTCANDVTARDLAEADGQATRAKAFDTFCPLGPVIATTLDPVDALISCRVNGHTRQLASTHDLRLSVAELIAYVSSIMTLLPGDVLLTGSPPGAAGLQAGDQVEVEIEGVGVLRNPVQAAA